MCPGNLKIRSSEIWGRSNFYIGIASVESFQKEASKILLDNHYIVDEYENSAIESLIRTKWKITYQDTAQILTNEYKTRFILIGKIDNKSFRNTNSFQYECYLRVENYIFDGNNYIENSNSNFIQNENEKIVRRLRGIFNL